MEQKLTISNGGRMTPCILREPDSGRSQRVVLGVHGLGGSSDEEKVKLLIAMLRRMNDGLNIPQCIKAYGADSYPTENGFVPEDVFLAKLPEIAANAILDGTFALIRPVITSTDGLCVATIRCIPAALAF